jgi:hypothetical protein
VRGIELDVAQIEGLISKPGALQQSEFPFPPPTVAPIPALGSPKTDAMRCTIKIGEECRHMLFVTADARALRVCSSVEKQRTGRTTQKGQSATKPQSAVAGRDPLAAVFLAGTQITVF